MNEITNADKWFSSLTTSQKKHIATKVKSKELGVLTPVSYPECTKVWLNLAEPMKEKIKLHCENDHDFVELAYQHGEPMSY